MKTVIRIEHLCGNGLFMAFDYKKNDFFINWLCPDLIDKHNCEFPTPFNDGLNIIKNEKKWFCAYKSIDQIKEWITISEINIILNNKFRMLSLDVNEYQEGGQQILFTKESIVKIEDISNQFK